MESEIADACHQTLAVDRTSTDQIDFDNARRRPSSILILKVGQ